jgi:hypothetical protein
MRPFAAHSQQPADARLIGRVRRGFDDPRKDLTRIMAFQYPFQRGM